MWNILLASFLSGMSSPAGAWLALRFDRITEKLLAFFLGSAGGIMITVILTELMPTSLAAGGHLLFWTGAVLGWIMMWGMGKAMTRFVNERIMPSEWGNFTRIGWFIATAMAIHDLPEGLAIGAADAVHPQVGLLIAFIIALHNVPEGMSIALPLFLGGVSKRKVLFITLLIGFVTPIGTLIALMLVQISPAFISLSLAFASGSMAFVVAQEVIPEAFHAHKWYCGYGAVSGALVMAAASLFHFVA